MRYLSVCSGIEAATVAWHPLGWIPAAFSEIDKAARRVLQHHYPHVPLHGDFTTIGAEDYGPIDLLVGGTPCQDFSVAGLRAGIAGDRGNLTLEFLRLAERKKPRWIVWENVPGVLSSDGGRALGAFLGGLAELGYGFAYRVLDAQYFGLAQRRARVFVVGYLGDWRRAAAVLFERESLLWNPAPRRETRERPAPTLSARPSGGGGLGTDFDLDGGLIADWPAEVAPTLNAHFGDKQGLEDQHALSGAGLFVPHAFDARQSDVIQYGDKTGPLDTDGYTMAIAFSVKDHGADAGPLSPTLRAGGFDKSHANGGVMPAVAFTQNSRSEVREIGGDGSVVGALAADAGAQQQNYVAFDLRGRDGGAQFEGPHDTANIRAASGGSSRSYVAAMQVRRLTPVECERLQGFPDGYTDVPPRGKNWTPDGPRYKQLGNSMAVPVMRKIGERIAMVEEMTARAAA